MKLVLHIDRLVLRGVPEEQRDAWVSALQSAFQESLSQPGAADPWSKVGTRERIRVPGFHAEPGAAPRQVGHAAVAALNREVTR